MRWGLRKRCGHKRVLRIPNGDVDVGIANRDLGRGTGAPKSGDFGGRRDRCFLRGLLAADLDGARAVGFDQRFAHDGAIRAVLGPDLEAGECDQNDDNDAHGDAQDTKAELAGWP